MKRVKNKKPLIETLLNKQELEKITRNIQKQSPYPNKVKIISVTKKQPYKAIKEAYLEGIKNIGENRIQEIEKKIKNKKIPQDLNIHLIGHLQRNKAKKAVKLCNYIQSIDSIKIAKKVNKEAEKKNKKQKIYLQINIGEDTQKHGFKKTEIYKKHQKIKEMKNLEICGIMTILPKTQNTKHAEDLYSQMEKISKGLKKENRSCKEISMGMSNDYMLAIKAGATNIRIGTKLYGERT